MTSGDVDYSPQYDSYPSDEYPPDWQARRRKVLQRDGYTCQGCGLRSTRVDDVRFDVDHIVPKSDGGSHALENLQTLCPSCHANKHPDNSKLEHRGRQFERRNKPSLLVRLVWALLGPFVTSVGPDEQTVIDNRGRQLYPRSLSEAATFPEGEGVSVEVTVTELWDSSSDSVQQLGRVQDVTDAWSEGGGSQPVELKSARFVVWEGTNHPELREGGSYRFVGTKTGRYDREFQLIVDERSVIQFIDGQ